MQQEEGIMEDGTASKAITEESDLDQLVGYNLKRAYMIINDDFRRALGEDGLSPRVFAALLLVVQTPNITQSALARRLGVERSGLVAIIDELEAQGYLTRGTVPGDRRVQALIPTESGVAATVASLSAVKTHENTLLSDFSSDEIAVLIKLLKKIRALQP